MTATTTFFKWFYEGLGGLGGWFVFLLLALTGMIWLIYDSANRRIPAPGWRLGVILTAVLILPAIVFRFTMSDPASPLASFPEPIFYMGILGGLLPVVLAVGYYVTYQGMMGCPQGHVYEAALGQCPYDAPPPAPAPIIPPVTHGGMVRPPVEPIAPLPEARKRHIHAWLVTSSGKDYQLFERETTIGRSSQNDIYLAGDSTISHQHAKIVVDQNGRFRLYDLGSKNYTRVNHRVIREPVLLEPDDEIQFGDNTVVHFVTRRR